MKTFLTIIIVFSAFNTVAQVDWRKSSHWKIYKIPEPLIFKVQVDSLAQLNGQTLQQDSMMMYMVTSTILPDSLKPIWMGGWAATYEFSGQAHKIEISSYGAFFYDQSSNRFYQISMELKEDWMTFIHQKLSLF